MSADPDPAADDGTTVTRAAYRSPTGADVVFIKIEGGGHTWPGGLAVPALGHTTTDLIADDAMWEFFQRYAL